MTDSGIPYISTRGRSDWVRLRTLIYLRWLAIVGQLLAVLVAEFMLRIDLRLDICLMLIGLSVAYNLGSMAIFPANKRLGRREAIFTLLFDLFQLACLLYFTGGLNNPFAVLIMAPTVISSTVLSLRATVLIGALTMCLLTALIWLHQPLQTLDGSILEMPQLLVYGMWTSLMIGVVFVSGYARRVTQETLSMSEALTATQLALEREQRLTALGGVVAAAAHELGTPLATIKLVSSELTSELGDKPELLEDVRLIGSQADRCREILAGMGRRGKDDTHVKHAPILAVVEEAAEPHINRGIKVIFRADGEIASDIGLDQPEIFRQSEIIHGLRNLVQNAVDFAETTVWIDINWTDSQISITVGDDGQGYPADLIGRIGDPFMRRRGSSRSIQKERPGYSGMGLGLFIAKTLLERTGARLTFANGREAGAEGQQHRRDDDAYRRATGAVVELIWDRAVLEAKRETTRGPLGLNEMIAE